MFIGFSYFFPPGCKILNFLTSDSDSLLKTLYIANFWSKNDENPVKLKNKFKYFTNLNVGLLAEISRVAQYRMEKTILKKTITKKTI